MLKTVIGTRLNEWEINKMKMQTELAHPDFGVVHIRLHEDGEVCIKQFNERLYLTTKQTIELSKLLNNLVRELE